MTHLQNLNIQSFEPLDSPLTVAQALPCPESISNSIQRHRKEITEALSGQDKRFLVIMGPCSIHDPQSAFDYADRLRGLREKVKSKMNLIMRVYFEKPRTTVGWKGLINDPHLDGSHDIVFGLKKAREILLKINALGVPCATEFLDPIVPQYTSDLVSWAAIGARTTESQTHRQMASGLSMTVGFKNATDGGLQVALDAMVSARSPHAFVGIDEHGTTSIVRTKGNPFVHLVLRGGNGKSNYSKADLAYTKALLEAPKDHRLIMVDCSHGNSNKNFLQQPRVFFEVLDQFLDGDYGILGSMLESHLVEGKQDPKATPLVYGKSITDGCINWETSEKIILEAFAKLPHF